MAWLPIVKKNSKMWHDPRTWQTDVRQTDTTWRHRPRLYIASRGKNYSISVVSFFSVFSSWVGWVRHCVLSILCWETVKEATRLCFGLNFRTEQRSMPKFNLKTKLLFESSLTNFAELFMRNPLTLLCLLAYFLTSEKVKWFFRSAELNFL